MTRIVTLTADEARARRAAALEGVGLTLEQWRARRDEHDCPCCFGEAMREEYVYDHPDGFTRMAELEEIEDMTYLLKEGE